MPNRIKDIKNKIEEMKLHGIFHEITRIWDGFSLHANSLIHDLDSNIVEHFHSLVSKFVGGKGINLSLTDSYTTRGHGALVHHNSKESYGELSRTLFRRKPSGRVERLLLKKKIKNSKKLSGHKKTKFEKRVLTTRDAFGNVPNSGCMFRFGNVPKAGFIGRRTNFYKSGYYKNVKKNQLNRAKVQ